MLKTENEKFISKAAERLRNFARSNWRFSCDTKQHLYEIADQMDNELTFTVNKNFPSMVCKPLLVFLQSYKDNGGAMSDPLMDKIIDYCSQIETNYQKLREHEQEMYNDYINLKNMVEKFKQKI